MKNVLIISPCATRSGYGDHARSLIRSLIKMNKFNITLISVPWGMTPMDALDKENDKDIIDLIHDMNTPINQPPDIFIQVSIPNEFQRNGKYLNIGITAGIETNGCSLQFIEGVNRMDMTIATSEFTKKTLVETTYKDNIGQEIRTTKPIEVLFEGIDTDIYDCDLIHKSSQLKTALNTIEESFNFLICGQLIGGEFGHDRKNIPMTIALFLETFARAPKKPGLILKTGNTFSELEKKNIMSYIAEIKEMVSKKIKLPVSKLPNVYLVHGNLTDAEMSDLYNHNKVKAMILLTKGEGFGRPLLEFTMTKKPIITTNWSGHLDFLNEDNSFLIDGKLEPIHESVVNDWLVANSQWMYVDNQKAVDAMLYIFQNYKSADVESKVRKAYKNTSENFTLDKMTEKFDEILEKYTKDIPEEITLSFPDFGDFEVEEVANESE